MERAGIDGAGIGTRYIKDALKEMAYYAPTHIKNSKKDITKDQRFYEFPIEAINITDIKIKNHMNTDGEYRSIPRLVYEPGTEDADDV